MQFTATVGIILAFHGLDINCAPSCVLGLGQLLT